MSKKLRFASSMFIGQTSGGVPQPVFYNSHAATYNNKPGGTLITGSPGSGKTYLALTLSCLGSLLGQSTVILDPKGDFAALYHLQHQIGKVNLIHLGSVTQSRGAPPGIIDPFNMSDDPGEVESLVMSVIDLFCGGLTDPQLTALGPIVRDVQKMPNPSLQKVVDELRGSRKEVARDLGSKLGLISRQSAAKLCFSPGNKRVSNLSVDKGVTIFTLVGIELPTSPEDARATVGGRLVTGILFLVTDFIRRMMNNDASPRPKSVVVDEASFVLATRQGAEVVKSLALMGRSKHLSVVLITQSMAHLNHLDIANTITTRFAFNTDATEAKTIIKAMDLPENEDFETVLTQLDNGECLMKDWQGRVSKVAISSWRRDWSEAFNTNPYEKILKKKAAEQARSTS